MATVRFIDLFAGIGGIRKGFEIACEKNNLNHKCVFTSEIKPHAIKILQQNHPDEEINGDITKIDEKSIPDFDFLLGGFPCQAFSSAGKRKGFQDTRGTLFFDIERILAEKKPFGFVLENVDALVTHDRLNKTDRIGRTFEVILERLDVLGYKVFWKILNSKNFGIPQERKRLYIVGTRKSMPVFHEIPENEPRRVCLNDILERGLPTETSEFIEKLLKHYKLEDLYGKSIKDKRGGEYNIHSWDIELKGPITYKQKKLLNKILTERRKKKWAEEFGIDWMDGMPLTMEQIKTFSDENDLEDMLSDLVKKKYLKLEHPKRKFGNERIQDETLPLGYNIVAGKMSYQVNKVLDPKKIAPTLVAMDMRHLYVVDGNGIRTLSLREGLRLFGYPDDYKFDIENDLGYDLLGNTVVVPIITHVASSAIGLFLESKNDFNK